jgi:hypothetical protein
MASQRPKARKKTKNDPEMIMNRSVFTGVAITNNIAERLLRPVWIEAITEILRQSTEESDQNFAGCFVNLAIGKQDEIVRERELMPFSDYVVRVEAGHQKFGTSISMLPPSGTCACGKPMQDCPHGTKK